MIESHAEYKISKSLKNKVMQIENVNNYCIKSKKSKSNGKVSKNKIKNVSLFRIYENNKLLNINILISKF